MFVKCILNTAKKTYPKNRVPDGYLGSKTIISPCTYPGKQCIAKGKKKRKTGSFNINTNEMAKTTTADLSSENNSSIKIYVYIILVISVITAAVYTRIVYAVFKRSIDLDEKGCCGRRRRQIVIIRSSARSRINHVRCLRNGFVRGQKF